MYLFHCLPNSKPQLNHLTIDLHSVGCQRIWESLNTNFLKLTTGPRPLCYKDNCELPLFLRPRRVFCFAALGKWFPLGKPFPLECRILLTETLTLPWHVCSTLTHSIIMYGKAILEYATGERRFLSWPLPHNWQSLNPACLIEYRRTTYLRWSIWSMCVMSAPLETMLMVQFGGYLFLIDYLNILAVRWII